MTDPLYPPTLIVTDIDGTIVSRGKYKNLTDTIQKLTYNGAVYAFNTTGPITVSKLFAEKLGFPQNKTVHIVESGAAIHSPIPLTKATRTNGYYTLELAPPRPHIPDPDIPGCHYERFTSMSPTRIARILGYDIEVAKAARQRIYTDAFWSPSHDCLAKAWKRYHRQGYYAHLGKKLLAVGPVPGKQKALQTLLQHSPRLTYTRLICLGDMDMDVSFLRLCHNPILINPKTPDRPWPTLYTITLNPPPQGWIESVLDAVYYGINP